MSLKVEDLTCTGSSKVQRLLGEVATSSSCCNWHVMEVLSKFFCIPAGWQSIVFQMPTITSAWVEACYFKVAHCRAVALQAATTRTGLKSNRAQLLFVRGSQHTGQVQRSATSFCLHSVPITNSEENIQAASCTAIPKSKAYRLCSQWLNRGRLVY